MSFGLRWLRCAGLFAGCLVLAGCTNTNSNYNQYFQLMRQSFKHPFGNDTVPRDQAAAVPYASIGYRLNGMRENLLVLATDTNGDLLWTSASHVVLVTRDGRLIRTVGLPSNIASVTPTLSAVTPPPGQVLKSAFTSIRSADFPEEGHYSVPIRCQTISRGRATITILGKALSTVRADEICQASSLGWSFRDNYWIDSQTGFVWRSIQHLTPKGDTVEMEVLRPPG